MIEEVPLIKSTGYSCYFQFLFLLNVVATANVNWKINNGKANGHRSLIFFSHKLTDITEKLSRNILIKSGQIFLVMPDCLSDARYYILQIKI